MQNSTELKMLTGTVQEIKTAAEHIALRFFLSLLSLHNFNDKTPNLMFYGGCRK